MSAFCSVFVPGDMEFRMGDQVFPLAANTTCDMRLLVPFGAHPLLCESLQMVLERMGGVRTVHGPIVRVLTSFFLFYHEDLRALEGMFPRCTYVIRGNVMVGHDWYLEDRVRGLQKNELEAMRKEMVIVPQIRGIPEGGLRVRFLHAIQDGMARAWRHVASAQ